MNIDASRVLRTLVHERSVAALGTLHDSEPYVSMVPFAVASTGTGLIIHVSGLAAHTQNMKQNERVSLLIAEPEQSDKPPQALARITIQGNAREVPANDSDYSTLRSAYLSRFPSAEPMFDFADFSLIFIHITSVRLVAGFAQAAAIDIRSFAAAIRDSDHDDGW